MRGLEKRETIYKNAQFDLGVHWRSDSVDCGVIGFFVATQLPAIRNFLVQLRIANAEIDAGDLRASRGCHHPAEVDVLRYQDPP
jgi:hypothetical protein